MLVTKIVSQFWNSAPLPAVSVQKMLWGNSVRVLWTKSGGLGSLADDMANDFILEQTFCEDQEKFSVLSRNS